MGKGNGGQGKGNGSNVFEAEYSFDIFSLKADGQTPTTFDDAVENFTGKFNDKQNSGAYEFDFAIPDDPVYTTDINTENSPLTFDLQAKEFKAGETITLLSGETAVDASSGQNLTAASDRIEFTLASDELANLGIDEFTLVINDEDLSISGLQTGGITIDTALATANGYSENDAVKYIIDNSLFDLVNDIRVSGGSIDDSCQIVSVEDGEVFASFTLNEGRPDIVESDPILNGDDVLCGGDDQFNQGETSTTINSYDAQDVLVSEGNVNTTTVNISEDSKGTYDLNYSQDSLGSTDSTTFDDLTMTPGDSVASASYEEQSITSASGDTTNQISGYSHSEI
jgi:hypothetical protein